MKTLSFNNNAGLTVNYLTDLIDGNEQFTVYQILTNTNGVEVVGLTPEVIAAGGDQVKIGVCYMLKDFIDYATTYGYNLIETSEEHPDPIYLVDNRGPDLEVLSVVITAGEYVPGDTLPVTVSVKNSNISGSGTIHWNLLNSSGTTVDSGTQDTGTIDRDETKDISLSIETSEDLEDDFYTLVASIDEETWESSNVVEISWSSWWTTREPSNVSAKITGSTTATVTWDDSAILGADGYKVYAGATLKATIGVGVQAADITELTADTEYIFKVVAYKGNHESTGDTDTQTTFLTASDIPISKITTPTGDQMRVIDTTIRYAGAAWSKLEILQMYAAVDGDSSKVDWIGSQDAILVNTPTFTKFLGYKGNHSNMAINTGWNPSIGTKYAQNDATCGVLFWNKGSVGAYNIFGAVSNGGGYNLAFLNNYNGLSALTQINCAGYSAPDSSTALTTAGIATLVRSSATQSRFYFNDAATVTQIKNSTPPPNATLHILCTNIEGVLSQYHDAGVGCFYAGSALTESEHDAMVNALNYYWNNIDPCFDGNVCVIGDSTIVAYSGTNSVFSYCRQSLNKTLSDIATAGETIAQQITRYSALAAGTKSAFNYVICQIGLNDLNPAESAATALGRYQDLLDDIATDSPSAKIIIATMTPCKQRLIDIYGAAPGLVAYQKWLDMNEAIRGDGDNALTGFDTYVDSHTDLLNDGNGNLDAAYDTGDHIHENNAGREIIANGWDTKIA